MAGQWMENPDLLALEEIKEKPGVDYAAQKLNMGTEDQPQFFNVFGLYVLTPEVFRALEQHLEDRIDGEIGLTEALEEVRARDGAVGLLLDGERFDVGLPGAYRRTVEGFGDE